MRTDFVEVTVEVIEGGVPMFHASSVHIHGLDVWLYQRDDGAMQPVFAKDAAVISPPKRAGGIDLTAAIWRAFPELIK